MKRSKRTARRGSLRSARTAVLLSPSAFTRSRQPLQEYEDRRTYHPGVRHPRTIRQEARTVAVRRVKRIGARKVRKALPGLYFAPAKRVLICVRRKRRKEVIHAKGYAGGKVRKPRRNRFSSINCR